MRAYLLRINIIVLTLLSLAVLLSASLRLFGELVLTNANTQLYIAKVATMLQTGNW